MPVARPRAEARVAFCLWIFHWVCAWATCLGLAPPALANPVPAPRVDAIELRSDAAAGRRQGLEEQLAFAPGDLLSEEAARRTLSNLYATGWIAEAEIHLRQEGTEVIAVVAVRGHVWVDAVVVSGKTGLRRQELERVIVQKPGTPLLESRVLRSFYALGDLYEREGFLSAEVQLAVETDPKEKRARIVFEVESGERAKVGEITFQGELGGIESANLLEALQSKPGKAFNRRNVAQDPEALRRWLVKEGRLMATVGQAVERREREDGLVHLSYALEVGPSVEVEVTGADADKLIKKGLLPFLGDQVYDSALVIQTCNRLEGSYQRKGHYLARVQCREEEKEGGPLKLHIDVDPGPIFKLAGITFSGNDFAGDEALLPLLSSGTRRGLRGGKLMDQDLEDDLANLRSYYLLQGFSEVEIGPQQVKIDDQELFLHIPITEGPRQRVVELRIRGAELGERPLTALPLTPGGAFHPALLEDTINVLRTLQEEEGYTDSLISQHLDWNRERTLVDVDIEIFPGPRTTVDRILLRGQQRTRPDVVRRFIDLEPGEAASRRRRLEIERDLYRLGIFSKVDVELGPASRSDGKRDLLVQLEEGRRWRLSYGFSYHSDDGLGGLLGISRSNVGGKAGRFQLDLRGNELDQRARLLYDQPSVGSLRLPLTYSLFTQREDRNQFEVDSIGTQVALTKDFPSVRLGVAIEYREVDLRLKQAELTEEVPREDQAVKISSLTPNLFVDRRDDPIDPSRGWSTALQTEYAFPLFLGQGRGEADFLKLFWQQTQYANLGRAGVLAGSFRLGAIEPFNRRILTDQPQLVPDPSLRNALVPPSERFFAGGRTTHRAYARDELGILGESLDQNPTTGSLIEAGGNGLFLANLDYRFPIRGTVGGTLFLDAGNIWADWRDFDPNDIRLGIGLGLRYRSPIGPLRLEVGWKLDRQDYESSSPEFFLSFGNPF